MVERWDIHGEAGMLPCDDGDYVKYEDHEALIEKVTELKAELSGVKTKLNDAQSRARM